MNYYISDLHLGHDNIIRMSNRPYTNCLDMDNNLIENWNSVINDNDDIYIGGDLIYKANRGYDYYLKQLKGKKHLIVGNHDYKMLKNIDKKKYFESIDDILQINDGDYNIVLCHYPMAEWPGFYRGNYHFFGHIHNNENDAAKIMRNIKNCYNIGADVIGFMPRTAKEIITNKYTRR